MYKIRWFYNRERALVATNLDNLTDDEIKHISMAMAIQSTQLLLFKLWNRTVYMSKLKKINSFPFLNNIQYAAHINVFNKIRINGTKLHNLAFDLFRINPRIKMKYEAAYINNYMNKGLIYIDSHINPNFIKDHCCLNVALFRLLIGNNTKSNDCLKMLWKHDVFLTNLFNYLNFSKNIHEYGIAIRKNKSFLPLNDINYIMHPLYIIYDYYYMYYTFIQNNKDDKYYFKKKTINMYNNVISEYVMEPRKNTFVKIILNQLESLKSFKINIDQIYSIMDGNGEAYSQLLDLYEANHDISDQFSFLLENRFLISYSNDQFDEYVYEYILKHDIINNNHKNPYLPYDISFDDEDAIRLFKDTLCEILYEHTRILYPNETADDYKNMVKTVPHNKSNEDKNSSAPIDFSEDDKDLLSSIDQVKINDQSDNDNESLNDEIKIDKKHDIYKEYYIYSPFLTTLDIMNMGGCKINLILSTIKPKNYPIIAKIGFYYSSKGDNKIYTDNLNVFKCMDTESIKLIGTHLLSLNNEDMIINVYYDALETDKKIKRKNN